MKQLRLLLLTIFLLNSGLFSQSYQGPEQGSLSSGITQTIDAFQMTTPVVVKPFVRNRPEYNEEPLFLDLQSPPFGSNYIRTLDKPLSTSSDFLIKSFNGINMTSSIPPDCNIAAGPSHVIATVNTTFTIWDKQGNFIKNINGETWAAASVSNPNVVCDPKIVYDHFDKRWVIVWLTIDDATQSSFWTVSVSDDSIPMGTWYSWATPSGFNGQNNGYTFGDYEGLGFDKDCLYITGNQFTYGSQNYFQYTKLRIIPKAQLYANTAGSIVWNDIWDIRIPNSSAQTFGIRPTVVFGDPAETYLVYGNRNAGNSVSLFKINNPLTSPSLTGFNVAVTYYNGGPDVDQLGGSFIGNNEYKIDGGSGQIRNEPVYRDGFLWFVHSVMNPENPYRSALHYVKIDVANQIAAEDVIWGDTAYWYSYPAIMVDKDKNVSITYSRSALTEYIGAFYSTRKANDPPGLSGSKSLAVGKGNYIVTFGGTRNRWGDYSGIALDPADEYGVWMLSEFAANKNIWGTYVGNVLAGPKPGVNAYASAGLLDFKNVEVTTTSDTLSVLINNIGSESLSIESISIGSGPFHLITPLSYPVTVPSFESLALQFVFQPTSAGIVDQAVTVNCNSTTPVQFNLKGKGYTIATTAVNTLYASTGAAQQGGVHTVNRQTGASTLLGTPTYPEIKSIAVNPKTKLLYGIASNTFNTEILRINAPIGDAYNYFTIPIPDMGCVAFDTAGNFYAASKAGVIYEINLLTKQYSIICTTETKTPVLSMSFNPANNDLWAVSNVFLGTGKDKVFKIMLPSGDTVNVGRTMTNVNTNAIAFDDLGDLYGVTGSSTQVNKLIKINTSTAVATQVGETAIKEVTGLSFSNNTTVGIRDKEVIPSHFILSQNYPNPFNPSTVIEYSLPRASNIKISVFNVLGQKISELVNTFQQAGVYKVNWNAVNNSGVKLSSGIYFYEMTAKSVTGEEFLQNKKMILIK